MSLLAPVTALPLPRDGPALCVGIVVAAYWWRVVRKAAKMRRRTGRAANFLPAERLGRALRVIWQPVVCLWIIVPLVTAVAPHLPASIAPIEQSGPLQWAGAAVAVLSYALTRVCWRRMGRSWRMGIDPAEKTTLIVTGPFAYVRHPIYALSSLMMLATVAAVPSIPLFAIGTAHLLLLQWEARREEAHLSRVHGPAYAAYRRRVGRFLPRPSRRPESAPSPATPLAR